MIDYHSGFDDEEYYDEATDDEEEEVSAREVKPDEEELGDPDPEQGSGESKFMTGNRIAGIATGVVAGILATQLKATRRPWPFLAMVAIGYLVGREGVGPLVKKLTWEK